jgi:hypothetical protein
MKLIFEGLGIISSEMKRALEDYVDVRVFRQRKAYDEYYIDIQEVDFDLDINDLLILADHFEVQVGRDCVYLKP